MKAFTMRAMTYEHLVFLTQLPINLSIHESIDGRNVLMCVIKNQQLPMIQYLYENISNPFHDIYTQDNVRLSFSPKSIISHYLFLFKFDYIFYNLLPFCYLTIYLLS